MLSTSILTSPVSAGCVFSSIVSASAPGWTTTASLQKFRESGHFWGQEPALCILHLAITMLRSYVRPGQWPAPPDKPVHKPVIYFLPHHRYFRGSGATVTGRFIAQPFLYPWKATPANPPFVTSIQFFLDATGCTNIAGLVCGTPRLLQSHGTEGL